MAKFLSGRQRDLSVGIASFTENKTVLQTTGKVGIGTTDAQQHSLFVVGSTNITGDAIVGGGATVVGIGSFQNDVYIDQQLYVGGIEIVDGATIGEDITARHLLITGIGTVDTLRTNVGFVTTLSGTNLTYNTADIDTAFITSGIVTTIAGANLTYTTADIDNAFITSGIVTTIAGSDLTYTTADIDNAFITSGIVTTLTSTDATLTNINSTGISTFNHTNISQLSVLGVSTFTGAIDANGGLDVLGQT